MASEGSRTGRLPLDLDEDPSVGASSAAAGPATMPAAAAVKGEAWLLSLATGEGGEEGGDSSNLGEPWALASSILTSCLSGTVVE